MNEKKIATIYDYVRLCRTYTKGETSDYCEDCPLFNIKCDLVERDINIEEINKRVVKWCKEHPVKTRQSEFLKIFPRAQLDDTNVLNMCPKSCDVNRFSFQKCQDMHSCSQCRKEYWLQEVE